MTTAMAIKTATTAMIVIRMSGTSITSVGGAEKESGLEGLEVKTNRTSNDITTQKE